MTRRSSRSSKSIEPRRSVAPEAVDISSVWLTVAVVWVVAFCCWFHRFSLPNNPGVQRWMLWSLIPFDLFDLIDPPIVPGAAAWSWLFLFQRVPFLFIAIAIWIGSWGAGAVVLRWIKADFTGPERVFFSICLGLSIVSLVTLILGVCGLLYRGLVISVLLVGPVVEFLWLKRSQRGSATEIPSMLLNISRVFPSGLARVILMGMIPFIAVQLLGAMTPQNDFDVVEYHLGGPKEWFLQGHISRLPHNVYTNFPFLSEMLILTGMVLYGDWQWGALAGQAAIAGFIPLTALGLYASGRRWFSSTAGWLAALIYLTSPWTYRISIIAYAEGSIACYLLASLYAALLFRERYLSVDDSASKSFLPLALLTGLMSGSAMACKYPGLLSVVIPIGLLVLWTTFCESIPRTRAVKAGALFMLGVSLAVGPWLVKNFIATGNPVYPLSVRVFGGVDRDEALDAKWRNGHASPTYTMSARVADLPVKVADVTANNDWHSPLMFGFSPLSLIWLLRRRSSVTASDRHAYRLTILALVWFYVLWQFFTWWLFTHQIDRFYVPMFSVVALLAGAGVCWPEAIVEPQLPSVQTRRPIADGLYLNIWHWIGGTIIVVSILYNADVMLHLGGFNAGRLDLIAAREIATPGRIRWLNEEFESGRFPYHTKVLCVGEAQMFHARYPYLYNTVFDRCLFEDLCAAPESEDGELRPIDDIRADLKRLGVTHIDVNWAEIERYRAPGSYGYTNFVQPERFTELQQEGLLGPSLFTTTDGKRGTVTGQVFPVID